MFNLCSYSNLKEEKNKECFDSEFYFYFYLLLFFLYVFNGENDYVGNRS
jgi:hypothetical protein